MLHNFKKKKKVENRLLKNSVEILFLNVNIFMNIYVNSQIS